MKEDVETHENTVKFNVFVNVFSATFALKRSKRISLNSIVVETISAPDQMVYYG